LSSAIDLDRFKLAHEKGGVEHGSTYATAIAELRAGQKRSHWIWYVFPQAFEGDSLNSRTYRIRSLAEAEAYVADDLLWGRYVESVVAVEQSLWRIFWDEERARCLETVLGSDVDARKFRSSLTLFFKVTQRDRSERTAVFREMVDYVGRNMPIIWGGRMSCSATLMMFQKWKSQ
jgi:uncharacterized protein (DUF1810 family)